MTSSHHEMLNPEQIIENLPYGREFLFAEKILAVDEKKITGTCFFPATHPSYSGHFKNHPVLPGVIVMEGMGQVALVAHAIFLSGGCVYLPVLHQITTEFNERVPVEKSLRVTGELVYFRNNLIKSNMALYGEKGELLVSSTALAKLIKPSEL